MKLGNLAAASIVEKGEIVVEALANLDDVAYEANTDRCSAECRQNLIRKRAYENFGERGEGPGREIDDWLSAERELNHHLGNQLYP